MSDTAKIIWEIEALCEELFPRLKALCDSGQALASDVLMQLEDYSLNENYVDWLLEAA